MEWSSKRTKLVSAKSKTHQKVILHGFLAAMFRFYGKKKLRSCLKLTIRNIKCRNAVLSVQVLVRKFTSL